MDKTLEFKKHTQQDKISIIVPCFNEEKALPKFYRAVSEAVAEIDGAECEFIFVDDGSSDRTPEILQEFSSADSRCRYLSFSRNFGKEAAMYAGLENASGDFCVFMDADLQHPPALLKEMYRVVKTQKYDCWIKNRPQRRKSFEKRTVSYILQNNRQTLPPGHGGWKRRFPYDEPGNGGFHT